MYVPRTAIWYRASRNPFGNEAPKTNHENTKERKHEKDKRQKCKGRSTVKYESEVQLFWFAFFVFSFFRVFVILSLGFALSYPIISRIRSIVNLFIIKNQPTRLTDAFLFVFSFTIDKSRERTETLGIERSAKWSAAQKKLENIQSLGGQIAQAYAK